MADYKELYLLYCKDLNNCFTKKDVKKHNAAMKKLGELFHLLEAETERSFLLELLQSEDKQTRALVAAHCLGLGTYISESKKVLSCLETARLSKVLATLLLRSL